jgi:hypothetical protein
LWFFPDSLYEFIMATRGIAGQISEDFIVYDAETTLIIPEFGGSNPGILSDRIKEFINGYEEGNSKNAK